MSLTFRRSKKFGPFRVTLSKGGISTSIGGQHLRLTSSSRGTYISAGTDGLRVRQRIDQQSDSTPEAPLISPADSATSQESSTHRRKTWPIILFFLLLVLAALALAHS